MRLKGKAAPITSPAAISVAPSLSPSPRADTWRSTRASTGTNWRRWRVRECWRAHRPDPRRHRGSGGGRGDGQGGGRPARLDRRAGLQRGNPAAQGADGHIARRLASRDRGESALGVLSGASGRAGDEGARAREHHRDRRTVEPHGASQYRRGHGRQDRVARARARAGRRTRALRHPRQHGDPGLHRHGAALRGLVSGIPASASGRPDSNEIPSAGSAGRKTSPTPVCSSRPTRRPTSPATRSE